MSRLSRRRFLVSSALGAGAATTLGCGGAPTPPADPPSSGGAGSSKPERWRSASVEAPVLVGTWSWGEPVCERAASELADGGSLLDAIEAGVRVAELDPEVQTVGYGGLPNEAGVVQLDAMIMRGSTLDAGAVGALEEIATPISVARRVLERTEHVYLVGAGAQQFSLEQGFEKQDLLTDDARRIWKQWQRQEGSSPFRRGGAGSHDTVGLIGVTPDGEAVVGMSTSGLPFKMAGRVGDSPLVGAGGYADAEVGAAAATGVGEEVIRVVGSYAVVEAMRHGQSPTEAAAGVLERIVRRRGDELGEAQVAFIAVRRDGAVGAAALKPGFVYAVHRRGSTLLREVDPLQPT